MTVPNRLYDGGDGVFPQVEPEMWTEALSSPEMVRISAASAVRLGLLDGRLARCTDTRCLNVMLTYPGGCPAVCGYCSHACSSQGGLLSARAPEDWPWVPFARLLDLLRSGGTVGIQQLCIATTAHRRGAADAGTLARVWRRECPEIPVCVLWTPGRTIAKVPAELHEAGVDSLYVNLDVATEELFLRLRGNGQGEGLTWAGCWEGLERAASVFGPGRFGADLVVGVGETERELLAVVQRIHARGGNTRLHGFRPEPGARLVARPAVPPDQVRRVQLARFLIEQGDGCFERMEFDDEGRLTAYGVPKRKLDALITSGTPFGPMPAKPRAVSWGLSPEEQGRDRASRLWGGHPNPS